MVVIVCGVSGAGKTTIGQLLAGQLGWKFYEGDDFHPQTNVAKMRDGVALTDEDRKPWLEKLRQLITKCVNEGENAVLACSALKQRYREFLLVTNEVRFVYLRGDFEQLKRRMQKRRGHFMNPDLLQSQFDALEEPEPAENAIVIELSRTPRALVEEIKRKLLLS
jgi:gluconokinase